MATLRWTREQFQAACALATLVSGLLIGSTVIPFEFGAPVLGIVLFIPGLATGIAAVYFGLRAWRAPKNFRVEVFPKPPAWVVAAIAVGSTIALGTTGFLAGRAVAPTAAATPALPNAAVNADLSLSFPDGWREQQPSDVAIALREPIAVTPPFPHGAEMIAGVSAADGPTLLSRDLLARLDGTPSAGARLRLGSLSAYEYRGLRPAGFRSELTLLVSPVEVDVPGLPRTGVVTVVCASTPATATAFADRCRTIASSLALQPGRRPLPLGPSVRYATLLSRVLQALNDAQSSDDDAIRTAETPAGQADGARSAYQAFAHAAAAVRRMRPSPADAAAHRRLLAALDTATRARRELTAAAAGGHAAQFAHAADRVRRSVDQVREALSGFRALGYDVPG